MPFLHFGFHFPMEGKTYIYVTSLTNKFSGHFSPFSLPTLLKTSISCSSDPDCAYNRATLFILNNQKSLVAYSNILSNHYTTKECCFKLVNYLNLFFQTWKEKGILRLTLKLLVLIPSTCGIEEITLRLSLEKKKKSQFIY